MFNICKRLFKRKSQYESAANPIKTTGTYNDPVGSGFNYNDWQLQDIARAGWDRYDGGNTLGTKGSEQGIVIVDLESINGARVTLEHGAHIAPFSITFGIYGLMFHTHFCNDREEARSYIERTLSLIDEVFMLYDIPEERRDISWNEEHNRLMDKLIE